MNAHHDLVCEQSAGMVKINCNYQSSFVTSKTVNSCELIPWSSGTFYLLIFVFIQFEVLKDELFAECLLADTGNTL